MKFPRTAPVAAAVLAALALPLLGLYACSRAPAPSARTTTSGGGGSAAPGLPAGNITAPEHLVGSTWQWVGMAGGEAMNVARPADYTIQFGSDGRVQVTADCNKGSGPVKLGAGTISINLLYMTQGQCAAGSYSERFQSYLSQAEKWSIGGNQLLLELPDGRGQLRLTRLP